MFPIVTITTVTDIFNYIFGWGVILAFFLYFIFALVALRQIEIMRKTIITPISSLVLVTGWFHLLLALGILAFSFLALY